eukprot:4119622-Alexandrium_andersonii.AAC.1
MMHRPSTVRHEPSLAGCSQGEEGRDGVVLIALGPEVWRTCVGSLLLISFRGWSISLSRGHGPDTGVLISAP